MSISPRRRRVLKATLLLAAFSIIRYLLMFKIGDSPAFNLPHMPTHFWPRQVLDIFQWTNHRHLENNTHQFQYKYGTFSSPTDSRNFARNLDSQISLNASLPSSMRKHRLMSINDSHSDIIGVSRMMQYCNSPFEEISGEEGTPIPGYNLKMIHAFTRHGDRTSIYHIRGFKPRSLDCNYTSWLGASDVKTGEFVARMRQFTGKQPSKSHFMNWSLFPNRKDCVEFDLTARGVLQHIKLGHFLKDKYINVSSIFMNNSDITPEVLTFSTSYSRSYQSAIAFLYGFLPVFNLTKLRIDHVSNFYFCTEKFSMHPNCDCKHAKYLYKRAKNLASIWNTNSAQYSIIKNIISNTFETEVRMRHGTQDIMDAFAPSICNYLTVPCSSNSHSRCINSTVIDTMWSEIVRSKQEVLNDPDDNHLKFSSIMMYPVLAEMTSRMVKLTKGKHTPRFVLHSGHDITITPLLHVLGVHDGMWPPYASRVVIELYSADGSVATSTEFFVRVLYNGNDVTRNVSFCLFESKQKLCNLKHFTQFIFTEMIQRFGFVNFPSACSGTVSKMHL